MKHENMLTNEEGKKESVAELEARIQALETELKKQKENTAKSSNLMNLIWGDKFENEFLH